MSELRVLREALLDLRETVDAYVSDDVGFPELAESMDKAYAALYPPPPMAGLEAAVGTAGPLNQSDRGE